MTIRKVGNVLTGYEDGQFIYEQANLAGATYEIRAHGDIATGDRQGTLWYADGDLIATVTTGATGQVDEVRFSPTRTPATYDFLTVSHDGTTGEVTITLPLGSYDIAEVQAPYGFALTDQTYTVTFGWNDQSNDVVLAQTIVDHTQDGDETYSYDIVNASDASDEQLTGQPGTIVFENARVLPVPETPEDLVDKIGVGIRKQDAETSQPLAEAVYELYTVDAVYDMDGNKAGRCGTLLTTSSPTDETGFTWFDVDVPIRGEAYANGERRTGRRRLGMPATTAATTRSSRSPAPTATCSTRRRLRSALPTRARKRPGRWWPPPSPTSRWTSCPSPRQMSAARSCPAQRLTVTTLDGRTDRQLGERGDTAHASHSGTRCRGTGRDDPLLGFGQRIYLHPARRCRAGWLSGCLRHSVQGGKRRGRPHHCVHPRNRRRKLAQGGRRIVTMVDEAKPQPTPAPTPTSTTVTATATPKPVAHVPQTGDSTPLLAMVNCDRTGGGWFCRAAGDALSPKPAGRRNRPAVRTAGTTRRKPLSKPAKLRVVIVEPGQYAREAEIDNTLEAEQAVVGGLIDAICPWADDKVCLISTMKASSSRWKPNRALPEYEDVVFGTFFICGDGGEISVV